MKVDAVMSSDGVYNAHITLVDFISYFLCAKQIA